MMLGRRLVAAAVLGLFVLGGAAACQTDPAVAAYVGGAEIRQERVNEIVDELRRSFEGELHEELDSLAEQLDDAGLADVRYRGQEQIDERLSHLRNQTLEMLVLTEAGSQYAEAAELDVPPPAPQVLADDLNLPSEHEFVQVFADFWAVMTALSSHAQPAPVTEEDQREVFENLRVNGERLPQPFEEVQPFLTDDALGQPVGFRNLLVEVIDEAEVRVQPGYDLAYQVPVTLGQAQSWLGVQISEQSSVRDAR